MDKLVLTAVAQVISAALSAMVTIIVLLKTTDVQRKLKEIDGSIKRGEIEFAFYSKSIDFAHALLQTIVDKSYEQRQRAVLPATQLRILLDSFDCLTTADREVFHFELFPLNEDFDRWKCDLHRITLTRVYALKTNIVSERTKGYRQ